MKSTLEASIFAKRS